MGLGQTMGEYRATARSIYGSPAREPLPDEFWPDALRATVEEATGADVHRDAVQDPPESPIAEDEDHVPAAPDSSSEPVLGEGNEDIAPGGDGGRAVDRAAAPSVQSNRATPAARTKARALLKTKLKLDVVSVIKFGEGDGAYQLVLADGRKVDLGRTAQFSLERAFRNSIIAGLGQQIPPIKKDNGGGWRKILDAMLRLLEIRPGFTEVEMVKEWVESFLYLGRVSFVPSLNEATEQVAVAFDLLNSRITNSDCRDTGGVVETKDGGRVVIKLRQFFAHLTTRLNVKLSQPDLAVLMGKAGFRRVSTLNGPVWKGERLRTQRVWVSAASQFHFLRPEDLIPDLHPDHPRYRPEGTVRARYADPLN